MPGRYLAEISRECGVDSRSSRKYLVRRRPVGPPAAPVRAGTQPRVISRSKLCELLKTGGLQSVHIDRARLVRRADVVRYVGSLATRWPSQCQNATLTPSPSYTTPVDSTVPLFAASRAPGSKVGARIHATGTRRSGARRRARPTPVSATHLA